MTRLSNILLPLAAFGIAAANLVTVASAAWWILVVLSLPLAWTAIGPTNTLERIWLACLVAMPLSAILSLSQAEDPWHQVLRLERDWRFLGAVPVYLVMRRMVPRRMGWAIGIVACGAVSSGIVAAYQFSTGVDRAHGVVHPILFGDTSMLLGILMLTSALGTTGRLRAILLTAGMCGVIACALSLTRNALLVLPVATIIASALVALRDQSPRALLYLGLGAVITATAMVLPGSLSHFSTAIEEIQGWWLGDLEAAGTSLGGRLHLWGICWDLWQQSPWTGNGTGDYLVELQRLTTARGDDLLQRNPALRHHAHSIYFQSLVTRGLVGFLPLLGLLATPFLIGWRWARNATTAQDFAKGLACLAVSACFLIFGIGEDWTARNSFISVFLLAQVPLLALCHESSGQRREPT